MTVFATRAAIVLLFGTALLAQTPAVPYRFERPVAPARAGAAVLPLDVALLAGTARLPETVFVRSGPRTIARNGPPDVRLFDGAGREVPYLFVAPPPTEPIWLSGTVLPIASTEKTSGFEVDLGSTAAVDRLQVQGLPAPFMKRLMLEGSGDRERWTVLAAEGTLFDLPEEGMRRLEVEFARGELRYFRVTWNDANSGRVPLPSRASARHVATMPTTRPLTAAIPFERRPSEPGRSRFRLRLPAAHLPIVRIDLSVEGEHLLRHATISEARFNGRQLQPTRLGGATLKRVTRDSVRADELAIPIGMPREAELELTVDDDNNPPLALTGVVAVFAELPVIYFESDGRPLQARYGNARLEAPRYDLEAARDSLRLDQAALATWGEPAARVETTDATPPAPMPETGATLDPGVFRHARQVEDGPAGLAALSLDAAVLAHSRSVAGQFSDVRLLDREGRQIPYVLERRDEPLTLDVPFSRRAEPPAGAEPRADRTWYTLQLPYEQLPGAHLTIETGARVFRRNVALVMTNEPDETRRLDRLRTLSSSEWTHAGTDTPAPPLQLPVASVARREVFLSIDEGDNALLPLQRITLLLPSYRLRFYRPASSPLTLVYGRDDLGMPEYDLALLAPQVLGAPADEISAGPEPAAHRPASPESFVTPPVFWGILAVAIAVLLSLIVRLVRSEPVKADA